MSVPVETSQKSLPIFGVRSHLVQGSPVYYDNLFTPQYVGRVSDLLAAQLKRPGLDELRLRVLLLVAVFEGYRNEASDTEPLAKPLVLECGVDAEKIAIGISFRRLAVKDPKALEGLGERLAGGVPRDSFEELLAQLYSNSDRLILRFAPTVGRFEAVAILALGTKPEAQPKPEVIQIGAAEASAGAEAGANYIQLADLDYRAALRETSKLHVKGETSLGELIARVAKESELEQGRTRVSGSAEEPDATKSVLSGATQTIAGDERVVVAGEGPADPAKDTFVISGAVDESPETAERIRVYQDRIVELQAQIAKLTERTVEQKKTTHGLASLLKKAWPFRLRGKQEQIVQEAKKDENSGEVQGEAQDEILLQDQVAEAAGAPARSDVPPASQGLPNEPTGENPTEAAGKLVNEIQTGEFGRTVSRAQAEAAAVRAEVTSQRAKSWMDGLMGELVAERARLQDLAKNVTTSVRQKEHHFKAREVMLQEDSRRKDDLLRQRDAVIARLKEQMSELNMTLERNKAGPKATTDVGHYKHKYTLAQKMLISTKEENGQLRAKVEDMRSQLLAAQTASKSAALPNAEFTALRVKFERTSRQLEDMKRQNRQLSDKLAETKKDRTVSGGNIEDLKRRLEAATKLQAMHTKETEQLRLQIDELKREEARLKAELHRVSAAGGAKAA